MPAPEEAARALLLLSLTACNPPYWSGESRGEECWKPPTCSTLCAFLCPGLLVAELNYGQSVHGAMAHASSADRSRSRPCFFRALFDRGETDGVCTEDHACTLRIVLRLLPHSSSTRNAAGVATAGRIILTCDDRPRHELLGRPECLSSRVGLCVV